MQDLGFAIHRFIANPRRFGAVAPSGQALAALMTEGINPLKGPVIELGPGTGVFTRALLDRGMAEEDLILVESDPWLANLLSRRFPAASVLCQDADTLKPGGLASHERAAQAISGLPLRNFSDAKVASILASVFSVMTQAGALYQFTYANCCPVADDVLENLGLEATCEGRIWRNFPPAWVFAIRRRQCEVAVAA